MSKRKRAATPEVPIVELSTPWIDGQHRLYGYPKNELPTTGVNDTTIQNFISERSAVHKEYIREGEKTKRLGYGLSAALFCAAVVTPAMVPEGREAVSLATSGGLTVFAAGAFGYSKLKLSALKQKLIAEKK